jgi:hypothetical protein
MYNGVKAMISKEKELMPKEEEKDVEVGRHMKNPAELIGFPIFPQGTKSLLSKNLTKDIWNKLHDAKDKHGFTFK